MEGVVIRKKNSCRVILTLEHIQRSIAVDVDESDLEPIEDRVAAGAFPA